MSKSAAKHQLHLIFVAIWDTVNYLVTQLLLYDRYISMKKLSVYL